MTYRKAIADVDLDQWLRVCLRNRIRRKCICNNNLQQKYKSIVRTGGRQASENWQESVGRCTRMQDLIVDSAIVLRDRLFRSWRHTRAQKKTLFSSKRTKTGTKISA